MTLLTPLVRLDALEPWPGHLLDTWDSSSTTIYIFCDTHILAISSSINDPSCFCNSVFLRSGILYSRPAIFCTISDSLMRIYAFAS